jgi:hypothetical protein
MQMAVTVAGCMDPVLRVGGRWDSVERRYDERVCASEVVVTLAPSQEQAFRDFAAWLPRHIEQRQAMARGVPADHAIELAWPELDGWWAHMLLHGGRGSGKSYLACVMVACYALALPGRRIVCLSPQQKHTTELRVTLESRLLAQPWRTWHETDQEMHMANGSWVEFKTGNKTNVKLGEVDMQLCNEAQEVPETSANDLAGCTARVGGLNIYTGNPPRRAGGAWFGDRHKLISDGNARGWITRHVDPQDNPYASRLAMETVAIVMDEQTRARELDGDMGALIGDVVLTTWSDSRVTRTWIPTAWRDVTAEVAERWYEMAGADRVGGMDWDKGAGSCWASGRFWLPVPELQARGVEPAIEHAVLVFDHGHRHVGITEADYPDAVADYRGDGTYHVFRKDRIPWVGDASGRWQGESRKAEEERDPEDLPSWVRMKSAGWTVIRPDPTTKGNPRPSDMRFDLARELLRPWPAHGLARVQFLLPSANEVVASSKKYPLKAGRPNRRSVHAHLVDAWSYCAWRRWGREFVGYGLRKPVLDGYQGVRQAARADQFDKQMVTRHLPGRKLP